MCTMITGLKSRRYGRGGLSSYDSEFSGSSGYRINLKGSVSHGGEN